MADRIVNVADHEAKVVDLQDLALACHSLFHAIGEHCGQDDSVLTGLLNAGFAVADQAHEAANALAEAFENAETHHG
ncbi:MAG: hypothetical protein QM750_00200 [Rubrivivax sp.]